MVERPRFSLRSLGAAPSSPVAPSIEEARAALGGRVSTEAGAGACVRVTMSRGPVIGVLICSSGDERDVWFDAGKLVRAKASDVASLVEVDPSVDDRLVTRALPPELETVAADARRFAVLREGERVSCLDQRSAERRGLLVEKCRYGALVRTDEGAVLAVSFRRIWSESAGGAPT